MQGAPRVHNHRHRLTCRSAFDRCQPASCRPPVASSMPVTALQGPRTVRCPTKPSQQALNMASYMHSASRGQGYKQPTVGVNNGRGTGLSVPFSSRPPAWARSGRPCLRLRPPLRLPAPPRTSLQKSGTPARAAGTAQRHSAVSADTMTSCTPQYCSAAFKAGKTHAPGKVEEHNVGLATLFSRQSCKRSSKDFMPAKAPVYAQLIHLLLALIGKAPRYGGRSDLAA